MILETLLFTLKSNNFRGNLTYVSARTKTLSSTSPQTPWTVRMTTINMIRIAGEMQLYKLPETRIADALLLKLVHDSAGDFVIKIE